MKSRNFCNIWCGGRDIELKAPPINESDLLIKTEGERKIYFSIVGNCPKNPRVALIGLCPGFTQLHALVQEYNKTGNFLESSGVSSFRKSSKNIIKMLRKIEVDKFLGIDLDDNFDFNNSDLFLTSSLVKCAALKEGKGRSDDFQPLDFDFGRKCMAHRFIEDINCYASLKKIIFFGKKAEFAVSSELVDGKSIKQLLEENGKEVIFLPHPSGSNNGGVARFLAS
ncbi:hypothetical protein FJZ17_00240 [Candidatus Pacearchaeota archaeon]|nr:hypothetical protein [Candidatus Pacearchaeota archaeon]